METWARCHVKFLPAAVGVVTGADFFCFLFFSFPTESKRGEREQLAGRSHPSRGRAHPEKRTAGLALEGWGCQKRGGCSHLVPPSLNFAEEGQPPQRTAFGGRSGCCSPLPHNSPSPGLFPLPGTPFPPSLISSWAWSSVLLNLQGREETGQSMRPKKGRKKVSIQILSLFGCGI